MLRFGIAVYTPIAADELAAFVAGYDLGGLVRAGGVPAGSVNTNLRVETPRGVFFLRVYEAVGAAEAERELRLVDHLRRAGVPTPGVIARRDGGLFATLTGRPAALFEFAAGRDLCHREVTAAHAHAVGEALARLHAAGRGHAGLGEGRFTLAHVRALVRGLATCPDDEVRALLPELAAEADHVARETLPLRRGVIHGDLFRDNVLFEEPAPGEAPRVAALIDFESASEGPLAYDVATCLLSWTFYEDFRADLGRALVAGYGALDAAERSGGLYREARRAALRFTVTRITDFHLRPQPPGTRREKDFRRYLARLRRLRDLGEAGAARLWGFL